MERSFGGGPSPARPYAVAPTLDDDLLYASAPRGSARAPATTAAPRATIGDLLGDDVELDSASPLSSLFVGALVGYASTALVQPFDVGKTLLQIQWLPGHDVELTEPEPESRDFGAEGDEVRRHSHF